LKKENDVEATYKLKGVQNKDIKLTVEQEVASDFNKSTITIEIESQKEISSIKLNNEEIEIPTKTNDKYVVTKEIFNNGTYTIIVKDQDGGYKMSKIQVKEVSGDLEIYTAEDLKLFRDRVNKGATFEGKNVKVMADIPLNEENYTIGDDGSINFTSKAEQWTPIGTFKGVFDGQNKTISNIYINLETGNNIGFFAQNLGSIKNVKVTGTIISNGNNIGGLCAVNSGTIYGCMNYINVTNNTTTSGSTGGITGCSGNTTISGCINYGTITSKNVNTGGIVGWSGNGEANIQNCQNNGEIYGVSNLAGILGCSANTKITITNCVNNNKVIATGHNVSGIVGITSATNENLLIEKCLNKSKIQCYGSGAGIAGRIQSKNSEIKECKNEGEIYSSTGGLIGGVVSYVAESSATEAYVATIEKCVNTGYVHAGGTSIHANAGGILGGVDMGEVVTVKNCYNTGNIVSHGYGTGDYVNYGVGGIAGILTNNSSSASTRPTLTITNCYNIGNITNPHSTSRTGQIIGIDYVGTRNVTNSYYLSTASGGNSYGGTSVSASNLKTYASKLGTEFVNTNNSYPILQWEHEEEEEQ